MKKQDVFPIYEDAELYDLEFAERGHELPFFLNMALQAKGPVLEVACGTGRLTIPIAAAGVDIDGLDIVPAMLSLARQKSTQDGLLMQWFEQDCCDMELPRKYELIFSATNAMQHLPNDESVITFLNEAKQVLSPGGQLVIDVFNPSIEKLNQTDRGRYQHKTFKSKDGVAISVDVAPLYDADKKRLSFKLFYSKNGLQFYEKFVQMNVFFPDHLTALCKQAGFEITAKYGDYDFSDFATDSRQQIYVCIPKIS